jgi:hypothetical protein
MNDFLNKRIEESKEYLPGWLYASISHEVKKMMPFESPTTSPSRPIIGFIGSYPSEMDKARGELFTGVTGDFFNKNYLEPLDLTRDQVFLGNLEGCEVQKDLDKFCPRITVALGKAVAKTLDVDFTLPHPEILKDRANSDELDRKIKQIAKRIKVENKVLKALDVWKSPSWVDTVSKSQTGIVGFDGDELLFESESDFGFSLQKNDVLDTNCPQNYKLGVVSKDFCEFAIDKSGKECIYWLQTDQNGQWVVEKPQNQKPLVSQFSLAAYISKFEIQKNLSTLFWGPPGQIEKLELKDQVVTSKKPISIQKSDSLKQIVYGVVIDPYCSSGCFADAHSDWTPPAAIEKSAHNFAKGEMVVGIQHAVKAQANVVESWIEQYPNSQEYQKALRNEPHKVTKRKFGDDWIHSGSWVLAVELGDKEWDLYQKGIINAFSPGGTGLKTPLKKEEMPNVEFIELTEKIINGSKSDDVDEPGDKRSLPG